MIELGIVREEVRPTSGKRKVFLRPIVSMEQLVSYEAERQLPEGAIGRFWIALRGG
jgi:hypothetical protein